MPDVIYFLGALLVSAAGFLAWQFRQQASTGRATGQPSKAAAFFEGVTSAVNKVFKGKYDKEIAAAAAEHLISPVILKAIVAKESGFNPNAINPEKTFTLDGVTYSPSDRAGRAKLRQFIFSGGNPKVLGLNPSIGLAQVRLGIARKVLRDPALGAAELFDPALNLRASAALLSELIAGGITLQTIDAYNVGQDLQPRNLPYRDAVVKFARQFEGDF